MAARVLLLATTTGYQTRAFGDAAERLGVELVFATDRCHVLDDPWRDQAIPIRFHDESSAVAAILESSRVRPIDGVLVVGDRPTVIAARVAQALGLPGHAPEAAAIARHKERTRERLNAAGLPVPWFVAAAVDANAEQLAGAIRYPAVLKPVALSGSRGVMRVDDAPALVAALTRLRELLRSPDIRAERSGAHERVLIEGFIPGREYAIEGILHRGTLHVLALFDKPDPLDGPFFEETIYATPSIDPSDRQAAIVDAVRRAADAIGLTHGPVHAECRVNEAGVFVLEVAARPIGGLCARALRFGPRTGDGSPYQRGDPSPVPLISLEEVLLRHAIGQDPDCWQRDAQAAGVMMIPIPRRGIYRRVDGLDAARAVVGIEDVRITAKVDQLLLPLPEGASYLGFIFARGGTSAGAVKALRDAHAALRFTIDVDIPLLARSAAAS